MSMLKLPSLARARKIHSLQPRTHGPRVVIVGAGFGGLKAARALGDTDMNVLVLDRNNYHGFWPLLYQVATAGVDSESVAYPVRAILRKYRNVSFRMATVEGVDFDKQVVRTNLGLVPYDYLILAAGSANNYFGNEALAGETVGLKDIVEAEQLRNRILTAFEQAAAERTPEKRRDLMTFAIVGGGPTGVELAGALSELIHHVLRKDYPLLDVTQAQVVLVEASDRILAAFPESLQQSALRKLGEMGVEVKLSSPVSSVSKGVVIFGDGTHLKASTVVWAAGVRAARLTDALSVGLGKGARVKVEPTLNLPGNEKVFAIGDMSYLEGYKEGQAYPMVAQVAIQQGLEAGHNILRQVRGEKMHPFRYFDMGSMATIGRRAAVFDAFGIRLTGRLAWLGWVFIHIIYLIGFRNRLIVMTNWVFNYFTYERGVRLITSRET